MLFAQADIATEVVRHLSSPFCANSPSIGLSYSSEPGLEVVQTVGDVFDSQRSETSDSEFHGFDPFRLNAQAQA